MNLESLREDKEIQRFFLTLVKSHLDTSGTLSRIDLLSCPVAQNNEGKTLIDELGQLLKVKRPDHYIVKSVIIVSRMHF